VSEVTRMETGRAESGSAGRVVGRAEVRADRVEASRPGASDELSRGVRGAGREGDRVELSARAQWIQRAKELPDVRTDLVQNVRSQIEAGSYDTAEKLETALDQMIDEERRWGD